MMVRTGSALLVLLTSLLGMAATQLSRADEDRLRQPSVHPIRVSPDCDRRCLYDFADQYMEALVRKDPSRLPLAKTVKFTEDNVVLQIGDGLWGTISGKEDATALKFADPTTGQVGYFGVIREHGVPAFYGMRMKVVSRRISEIETILSRPGSGPGPGPDERAAAFKPPQILLEDLSAADTRPRERLIAVANGYFNTMLYNDGALFTPFDEHCTRVENGGESAGAIQPDATPFNKLSCGEQFKTGTFRRDTDLRQRRFPLVDTERGLVLAGVFIDHSATVPVYPLADGTPFDGKMRKPSTWCMLELFKVKDGKLAYAYAIFMGVPYRSPSPWFADDQ
jgi:hypothetical protein